MLEILKWKSSYFAGVSELDSQHKKLFRLYNSFYQQLPRFDKSGVDILFNALLDFSEYHFQTEAIFLDHFDLPGREKLNEENEQFLDSIIKLKSQMDQDPLFNSVTLANKVKKGVVGHIKNQNLFLKSHADLPFDRYFQERERAFFPWCEQYNLGIERVDQQHRVLVDLINTFYGQLIRGNHHAMEKLLKGMEDYAEFHFKTEEDLFKSHHYPEQEDHLTAHREFTTLTQGLQERLKSGSSFPAAEVTRFLKKWLVHHILVSDKKYVPFFKELGID